MKNVLKWMLAFTLLLGMQSALTAQANTLEDLTGTVWTKSNKESKEALIYGVECAVAIEFFVAEKRVEKAKAENKKSKKSINDFLSPFPKGWSKAFMGVSRHEIVKSVDAWYAAHTDRLERPVFEVIWYELIAPKLEKR